MAAAGPEVGLFLEIHLSESAVVFEPGAVLPLVAVSEGLFGKAAVFVVGGAFEDEDGKRPAADAETRAEPESAAEPGPGVLGCERGRNLPPEAADFWNSRILPGAELLIACEAVCKSGPQKGQEHPPEGLTGATVAGHCLLGSWVASVILVRASRAGQETGPGSNPVGKMAVGGTWSGFGSEGNGTDPGAGSWSQAELLSG